MANIREILAIPFGWILSFFYMLTGNYLLSLFILTLIFKVVMLPSSIKQQKGSAKQVRLQAKTKKIQEMYKGDSKRIQEETTALYRREGFNPMSSGCAPLLIQMPVMLGLYGVIYSPLTHVLRMAPATIQRLVDGLHTLNIDLGSRLQLQQQIVILDKFGELKNIIELAPSIVAEVERFITAFNLWGMNLTKTPSYPWQWSAMIEEGLMDPQDKILLLIPILSLVTSMMSAVFMYIKQLQTNPEAAKNPATGCMTLFSPLLSVYFTFLFPAGVGMYWIMSNVLAFVQTVILSLTHSPKKIIAEIMIEETIERRSREKSLKITKEYLNQ